MLLVDLLNSKKPTNESKWSEFIVQFLTVSIFLQLASLSFKDSSSSCFILSFTVLLRLLDLATNSRRPVSSDFSASSSADFVNSVMSRSRRFFFVFSSSIWSTTSLRLLLTCSFVLVLLCSSSYSMYLYRAEAAETSNCLDIIINFENTSCNLHVVTDQPLCNHRFLM